MNPFRHEAVFYEEDDEYLSGTLPPLREAIAGGGAALVAVGEDKRELLRAALGPDARHVAFADMARLGRNPNRIIPAWREFLRSNGDRQPVVGIGEPVWPGRGPAELDECERHESLLNTAFDGGAEWLLLCPYDVRGLPADVVETARRTHPYVGGRRSDRYVAHPPPLADALPPPTHPPAKLPFARYDLDLVRTFVTDTARRAGLTQQRLRDLVLAINELAANSLEHGGGHGDVRLWEENGTLLCEVHDGGRIEDPLVGRDSPGHGQPDGRGLWLVNHLCDLVQLRSSDAGTVIRVHMTL